jgi:lipoprotein signal peptidase
MTALVIAVVLVPVIDQAIKHLVRDHVGTRSVSLGVLGDLRVVQTEVWAMRVVGRVSATALWFVWFVAAGACAMVSSLVPSSAWAFGLLLGGSLSHALETTFRGFICDYVCLRFWPAFNLADIALVVGGFGVAIELFGALR